MTQGKDLIVPTKPVKLCLPVVCLILLALQLVVFVAEIRFTLVPPPHQTPNLTTLLALGGLSGERVFRHGEWYRLFTAPMMHARPGHLIANSIALLLGGTLLERIVGRGWFLAFFVVGGLSGSLMSLLLNSPRLVSVGASGAVMGVFAALYVSSFRMESERDKLQRRSLGVLIPSLLPLAWRNVGHIDYAGHFGGAIGGVGLALIVLTNFWPKGRTAPYSNRTASTIGLAGALVWAISCGMANAHHEVANPNLIPDSLIPTTTADIKARAMSLVDRYPLDPRSHYFYGQALMQMQAYADAERELSKAMTIFQVNPGILDASFGDRIRFEQTLLLAKLGRTLEAQIMAAPLCRRPLSAENEQTWHTLVSAGICN